MRVTPAMRGAGARAIFDYGAHFDASTFEDLCRFTELDERAYSLTRLVRLVHQAEAAFIAMAAIDPDLASLNLIATAARRFVGPPFDLEALQCAILDWQRS